MTSKLSTECELPLALVAFVFLEPEIVLGDQMPDETPTVLSANGSTTKVTDHLRGSRRVLGFPVPGQLMQLVRGISAVVAGFLRQSCAMQGIPVPGQRIFSHCKVGAVVAVEFRCHGPCDSLPFS